jgi:autotransporter-associated beta strand protein
LVLAGSHTYAGATTISEGTLGIAAGATLATAMFDVAAGATLDVRDAGGYVLGAEQRIKGGGTVLGELIAQGTVAPGASPGILSVDDITFGPTGLLEIEIGGETRGTEYDVLVSSGDVVLQGGSTLAVSLISPFAPEMGNEFDILDFSTITGQFTTYNLPALGGDLMWDTSGLYTDGTIGVAPEPATLALMGIGCVIVALRRRGR